MATGICSASAQSVTQVLDTNVIAIGEPTALHMYADWDVSKGPGAFTWPTWNDTLPGGLEILERLPLDTLALEALEYQNIIRVEQTFLVTSWDSGFRAIPPVQLVWNDTDTLASNPLLLEVRLSPPGEAGKIAAPAQIKQVEWTWQEKARKWLPLLLAILALAGLAYWLIRKIKNKPSIPVADETLTYIVL